MTGYPCCAIRIDRARVGYVSSVWQYLPEVVATGGALSTGSWVQVWEYRHRRKRKCVRWMNRYEAEHAYRGCCWRPPDAQPPTGVA